MAWTYLVIAGLFECVWANNGYQFLAAVLGNEVHSRWHGLCGMDGNRRGGLRFGNRGFW